MNPLKLIELPSGQFQLFKTPEGITIVKQGEGIVFLDLEDIEKLKIFLKEKV